MGLACYSIVLGAAIAVCALKNKVRNRLPHASVLSLMLWGGSIALIIDHFLNGELFLIGENIAWDLLVGTAMMLGIFVVWGIYVVLSASLKREHKIGA